MSSREAAIERVKAYVDAWSVYKDSAVACMRDDAPLILGDLRALLALAAPVEGGVTEPVAWRVKDFADGWTLHYSLASAEREAEGAGNLIQPLFAQGPHQSTGAKPGRQAPVGEPQPKDTK